MRSLKAPSAGYTPSSFLVDVPAINLLSDSLILQVVLASTAAWSHLLWQGITECSHADVVLDFLKQQLVCFGFRNDLVSQFQPMLLY